MSLTVRDDLGRAVTLAAPARRIVSLSPAATENLFAVGAGGAVVGATAADTYPAAVRTLTRVGDFGAPAYERILSLRPDLIVVESATVRPADVENVSRRLRGAPVFAQRSVGWGDVLRHLDQFGRLTGHAAEAARQVAGMNAKAARAARLVAGKPPVTVFVEVSPTPLYAAGPGSFVDDLIRRAGGVNVVKGTNPYPVYSKEALLAADPHVYVVAAGGDMGRGGAAGKPTLPAPLDRLTAAKAGRVYRLPADLLFRPTPRLADGLLLLAKTLHGG
jgi:iron complex transport system substrate-binding protein